MADLMRLQQALQNAHRAGDQQAARALAAEIIRQRQQAQMPPQAQAPNAATPTEPLQQDAYTGSVLPFSRGPDGQVRFDSDAGVLGVMKRAASLPGDVAAGRVDPRSDEAIGRAAELAAMATPITPAMRVANAPGVRTFDRDKRAETPTADELIEAAQQTFQQLEDANIQFPTEDVARVASRIQNELNQGTVVNGRRAPNIGDELASSTHNILRKLQEPPSVEDGAEVTVPFATGTEAARRQLNILASRFNTSNPYEQPAAAFAARRLVDAYEGDGLGPIVLGRDNASEALKTANRNYAAGKRSRLLTGIENDAELQAAGANSGQNLGNATRQRVKGLLTNKGAARDRAGFTDDEFNALRGVVEGSHTANVTRDLGNALGGGRGLGGTLAGGAGGAASGVALGGGLAGGAAGMAAVMGTARGSRALSNLLTQRALRRVDRDTRRLSPLYEQRLRDAPPLSLTIDTRSALARAYLAQLLNQPDTVSNVPPR